jgi:hypothetical protein
MFDYTSSRLIQAISIQVFNIINSVELFVHGVSFDGGEEKSRTPDIQLINQNKIGKAFLLSPTINLFIFR